MRLRLPSVGHPAVIEAGLIALAIADAVLHAIPDWPVAETVVGGIAVLALLLRHRYRYLALFLTLPALTVSPVAVPSLIALYTVAATHGTGAWWHCARSRRRSRRHPVAAGL